MLLGTPDGGVTPEFARTPAHHVTQGYQAIASGLHDVVVVTGAERMREDRETDILQLLRRLIDGTLKPGESEHLVNAAIQRTLHVLYWISARRNYRLQLLGLEMEDIAYDMIAELFAAGHAPVLIRNTDSPDLPLARVQEALYGLVAEATGFSPDSLSRKSRLLDDLNLDSIKAGDLIARFAKTACSKNAPRPATPSPKANGATAASSRT